MTLVRLALLASLCSPLIVAGCNPDGDCVGDECDDSGGGGDADADSDADSDADADADSDADSDADADGDTAADTGDSADTGETGDTGPTFIDLDQDGVDDAIDCDSSNETIGAPVATYPDCDWDGFPQHQSFCPSDDECPDSQPPKGGYLNDTIPDDCEDADDHIYPGSPDAPHDGVDQDCDGGDPAIDDAGIWYVDPVGGDPGNDGSSSSPYSKLEDLLGLAASGDVIVMATGSTFEPENVDLNAHVFGGYDASDWSRTGGVPVITVGTLEATDDLTLDGVDISGFVSHAGSGTLLVRDTFIDSSVFLTGTDAVFCDSDVQGNLEAEAASIHLRRTNWVASDVELNLNDSTVGIDLSLYNAYLEFGYSEGYNTAVTMFEAELGGNGGGPYWDLWENSSFEARESIFGLDGGVNLHDSLGGGVWDSEVLVGAALLSTRDSEPYVIERNTIRIAPSRRGAPPLIAVDIDNSARVDVLDNTFDFASGAGNIALLAVDVQTVRFVGNLVQTGDVSVENYGISVEAPNLSSASITIVHNTMELGGGATAGIYMDGQFDGVIANNIFDVEAEEPIGGYFDPASTLTLLNNTLVTADVAGCLLYDDETSTCYDLAGTNACGWPGCTSASGNSDANAMLDSDGVPMTGSPAIDGGIDPTPFIPADVDVSMDLDLVDRPQGGGWDMGAYEQ